jgi:thioredoxin 1
MVQELTNDNFQQKAMESDVPVLVDFWSPNCGPCRQIAPVIDQLAQEADGRFRVGKVNVFEQQDLGVRYGITAIPTLLFMKDGEVVHKLVGYQDKRKLLAAMQLALDRPVKQAAV